VSIVSQNVLFDDEISTITYFKDITFGVLYEHVKAANFLQRFLSTTLHQKMMQPINTIIESIQHIEKDACFPNMKEVATQITQAKHQCKLMAFKLRDMQDWDAIKSGSYRTISEGFNLMEAVTEVHDTIASQCAEKGVILTMQTYENPEVFHVPCPQMVVGDKLRMQ
jgi:signal transduction histidine kinase